MGELCKGGMPFVLMRGTTGVTFCQSPIRLGGAPTPMGLGTALLYALCNDRGIGLDMPARLLLGARWGNSATAAAKACSALKFSPIAAGAVMSTGLDRSLPPGLVKMFGRGGACSGASSPAIALNLLGNGALGSSVYSGSGRKLPVLSTLTRSCVRSSSV